MGAYTVGEIRAAGLQARWTRTSAGAPIIVAKHDLHGCWYVVDRVMWDRAKAVGIKQAFDESTLLGNFFSVKA